MESGSARGSDLPPGFRFHPTDEELIVHYLCNQATSKPCPASIIPEVDIYKFDPWQLPEKAVFGENEWYFFTPRDRKYPNGVRPNRATVSGYWKATGTDKAIYSGAKHIGVKKALVFYKGKPPKGIKTDWIMHEYRLIGSPRRANKHIGSMRLDDWVLCRIYKKKHIAKSMDLLKEEIITEEDQYLIPEMNSITTEGDNNKMPNLVSEQQQMVKFPRTCSLAHLLDMDSYLAPISHLLSEASYNSTFDYQINTAHNNNNNNYSGNLAIDPFLKPHHQVFEVPDQYYATSSSTTSQYL